MSEIKVIPPLSPEERAKIDERDPDPAIAKCGECARTIYKSSKICANKYCPVFPRKL